MWLIRSTLKLVRASPSGMLERYPANGPFVDGSGNAQSNAFALRNPDTSAVDGWDSKYWILTGDVLTLMDQAARDAVDVAEAAAVVTVNRADAVAKTTEESALGMEIRELIELTNKRDNYLVNRITELQGALDAVKASSGPADNIRTAIPASWLGTSTRTRAEAITDYTDDINAGGAD